ncbi:MAG: NADH-quinone oxidoreductase subunit NuoH [Chloroflexi bacterium HGW-Chloroflexi-5]|jgi:NADH-quinone oxidoreductase subunit H|nr:MAG: NADH-quinone oxidoreductase subunit NuoH [Chloroflexi bacterium HGW-Chloroflexi-5]
MNFFYDPVPWVINWLTQLLLSWGLSENFVTTLLYLIGAVLICLGAMLFTTMLIWAERKIGGRFQDRLGPNRVGPWGIFQSIADMLKIFTKEYINPVGIDKIPFNLAPILAVAAVLAVWAVIPFSQTVFGANINVGILYIIAIGGLGEMAIILAGFGSNNKYALLGAFRAVAQLISYEVPMVIVLLIPVMFSGSMGLNDIVQAQTIPFIVYAPVACMIFFICSIAENGRAPFDLLEADSELVAGYNIEYSGLKFGMFFVADFLHAFTSAIVFTTIFLGGWQGPGVEQIPVLGGAYMLIKTLLVYFLMLAIRFTVPRFRIDQMMALNWKILTPLALVTVVVTALVDKAIPHEMTVIRIGALLVANLIIWLLADRMITIYRKRNPVQVVTGKLRPLARPEFLSVAEKETAQ